MGSIFVDLDVLGVVFLRFVIFEICHFWGLKGLNFLGFVIQYNV